MPSCETVKFIIDTLIDSGDQDKGFCWSQHFDKRICLHQGNNLIGLLFIHYVNFHLWIFAFVAVTVRPQRAMMAVESVQTTKLQCQTNFAESWYHSQSSSILCISHKNFHFFASSFYIMFSKPSFDFTQLFVAVIIRLQQAVIISACFCSIFQISRH